MRASKEVALLAGQLENVGKSWFRENPVRFRDLQSVGPKYLFKAVLMSHFQRIFPPFSKPFQSHFKGTTPSSLEAFKRA
jgi:hypothetical protein